MARDGKLTVVEGIWLSSAVLLPLGIFFTYKAMRDSAVFNIDAYRLWWLRMRGRLRRELEVKEFVMQEIDTERGAALASRLAAACRTLKTGYDALPLWKRAYYYINRYPPRQTAQECVNDLVEYLTDSRSARVIALVNRLPFQVTSRNAAETAETADAIKHELLNPKTATAK